MSPRIAVIGTCQTSGIGMTLERLLPGAVIKMWHINNPESPEAIAEQVTKYDVVFSQETGAASPVLQSERLEAKNGRVILLPVVVFSGLHPDCIYLMDADHKILESTFGPYHSAIAVAGFLLGLSPERTCGLYNAFVQAHLGYFKAFDDAETALVDRYAAVGLDLKPHVRGWLKDGPFMHTINHAAICALSAVATLGARSVGLIGADIAPPRDVPDTLLNGIIWPTYPAIAQRLGIKGSTILVRSKNFKEPDADRSIPMDRFVEECHAFYRTAPRDKLETGYIAKVSQQLSKLLG
jgi:hypothetical protein